VDSIKVGNLATAPNVYNQYRVDVATAFPGLNNSGGPVGAYLWDTTTYPNGVHTIFWIATDDAGAADGIGSRYFNVVNTGTSSNSAATNEKSRHREERGDAAQNGDMHSLRVPVLADLLNLPMTFELVRVKTGFDPASPAHLLGSDNYGVYHIDMKEVEPIKIFLDPDQPEADNPPTPPFRKGGDTWVASIIRQKKSEYVDVISTLSSSGTARKEATYAGYMIAGEELRPLPIGSTLDPKTGVFSWIPGPGFIGSYDLVFVGKDANSSQRLIKVKVTIRPKY
jgi:hypothetical protein